jgi:hypothetical protein
MLIPTIVVRTRSHSQEIARRYPNELNVLDTRAFFWPGWWGEEVQMVHETDDYDFHKSGQYA